MSNRESVYRFLRKALALGAAHWRSLQVRGNAGAGLNGDLAAIAHRNRAASRNHGRRVAWYLRPIALCMPVWYYMTMKRTALFLKEEQIKKLQRLSDKTGAPVAELVRRAIDEYLKKRAKELK